jgi:carbonic anhydrase/acetyltransferase-like protein (isoleucine patch superfamily)
MSAEPDPRSPRHRGLVLPFLGKRPIVHPSAFLAEQSAVIGDVVIGEESSIWFNTTVRADQMPIRIGARSNVQDNSVVHVTTDVAGTVIGDEVTVGHRVILHACSIGNRVLVGMGSIVLDLAVIEDDVLLAAGSLVTPRTVLPSGWLCRGSPAKPVRPLEEKERAMIRQGWIAYTELSSQY